MYNYSVELVAKYFSTTSFTHTAEEVEGGSLNILVKYNNYIPVMNKKKNLCNIPDILSEPCPLQSGVHDATFAHKFPSYAPSVSHSSPPYPYPSGSTSMLTFC